MAKSIGIDLGTTNSVVAIKKVHTEIIKNSEGEELTPSCVTLKSKKGLMKLLSKENFVVGRHALEWMKQDPVNTVTAVKRLMGRSFTDPAVQILVADGDHRNVITPHSRGTENSLAIVLAGKEFTPEQLSAKILEKIHSDAEAFLKDRIEYAVITVPAYFNDKQKHATRSAAALAGLKVQRLLPEPTAAAISFGVDSVDENDAKTVLVFDFGGGTFDLSVLTISGGQFIEQGKGGDMWLGGEDIDRKLMDHVLNETAREYDIEDIQAFINSQDETVRHRFLTELKYAVERAKIDLSDKQETAIELLGLLKDADDDLVDVDVELDRETFDALISPLLDDAMGLVRKLLEQIHFTPDLIDKVLLVGGSSKIPCIIKAVQDEFGIDKTLLHERPMLAIAEGAAILSHRLSDVYECPGCGREVGQSDPLCPYCEFDLDGYRVSDSIYDIIHSAAHDYYICLENGDRYPMIEKNTPLPCERTERFKLVDLEQKLVHMKFVNQVNEQEENIGELWLGIDDTMQKMLFKKRFEEAEKASEIKEDLREETHFSGLEDLDRERPIEIEVTLKIDENNLLTVEASIPEIPECEISKTLSRGKADERLFLEVEDFINEVNRSDSDGYSAQEATSRSVIIIKEINKVINETTGEIIEPVYERARQNIDISRKAVKEGVHCFGVLYYCNSVLRQFGAALDKKEAAELKTARKHLQDMIHHGSYEENVKACETLEKKLNKNTMINVLMTLQKAESLCHEHEPSKAARFTAAIQSILYVVEDDDDELGGAGRFERALGALRDAEAIIEKYDFIKTTIHKGITT